MAKRVSDRRGGCALSSDMSVSLQKAIGVMRRASLAVALAMSVAGTCYAQSIAPFNRLAGQWSGSGKIELSDGTHEFDQVPCSL